jgi:hypothetical protein
LILEVYVLIYLGHGMKHCTFNATPKFATPLVGSGAPASKEVFLKTFGLFCALQDTGCLFSNQDEDHISEDDDSSCDTEACILYEILRDVRSPRQNEQGKCRGKLIFK